MNSLSTDQCSLADLRATVAKFPQYSLSQLAERKMRQLGLAPHTRDVFHASQVLSQREATTVYFSIPFVSTPPQTRLVYSSTTQPPRKPSKPMLSFACPVI